MARTRLSSVVSDVRGTVDNKVFARSNSGTVVRRLPEYKYPLTPAQSVINSHFVAVMQAYNSLTREQAMQWNAYSETLTRHNPVDSMRYSPTGLNVFVGLALKFLQIHPEEPIPLTPPTSSFLGDTVVVRAEGGAGHILFTASKPNAAQVQTELLLQRLKTPRRKPSPAYRSQAFVAFSAGALSHAVVASAGFYAPATRFVNPQTGQMTPLQTLEVVEVI